MIARIASVEADFDQRPAGEMEVALLLAKLEDPQKLFRSASELAAISGQGPFEFQKPGFKGPVARATLEELPGTAQGFRRIVVPVLHAIGVAELGVGTGLDVENLRHSVPPGIELVCDQRRVQSELNHLRRIFMAKAPAPLEEGLYPRERAYGPGYGRYAVRIFLLQSLEDLAHLFLLPAWVFAQVASF